MNTLYEFTIRDLIAQIAPEAAAKSYPAALLAAFKLPWRAALIGYGHGGQRGYVAWIEDYVEPQLIYEYDTQNNPMHALYGEQCWSIHEALQAGQLVEKPDSCAVTIQADGEREIIFLKPDPAEPDLDIYPGWTRLVLPVEVFLQIMRKAASDWMQG